MTCKELMAKYGASKRVIETLGVVRLNAMTEDAQALLIGMSKRPGPSRKAINAAKRRIGAKRKRQRAARSRALTAVLLKIGGEPIHMAPMAVMGAEMIDLPPKKMPRRNAEDQQVDRLMELSRRVG